ncbi:MAG: ATPase [Deltaproteobacteria bacterium]|nr:ATPase [Candidatus Anaeroferrophillus wilburensis]MBN2888888.1 ATPase [Deltaproteobacteria bacterium]
MKNRTVNEVYRKDLHFKRSDPYLGDKQFPEPTVCSQCGIVYVKGMWWDDFDRQQLPTGKELHEVVCPACRRIMDKNPAGYLYLADSEFLRRHAGEIEQLLVNKADQAKTEHPLQRIMTWEKEPPQWEITTTSDHLAVRLGKALNSAFKGNLEVKFSEGLKLTRVYWERQT